MNEMEKLKWEYNQEGECLEAYDHKHFNMYCIKQLDDGDFLVDYICQTFIKGEFNKGKTNIGTRKTIKEAFFLVDEDRYPKHTIMKWIFQKNENLEICSIISSNYFGCYEIFTDGKLVFTDFHDKETILSDEKLEQYELIKIAEEHYKELYENYIKK